MFAYEKVHQLLGDKSPRPPLQLDPPLFKGLRRLWAPLTGIDETGKIDWHLAKGFISGIVNIYANNAKNI